ncbi:MAG: hypothetical protein GY870_10345, partial [archaeon]|nr:hypothetical protein [archaeon]
MKILCLFKKNYINRNKKIFVLLSVFLLFGMQITYASAWKNGSYAYNQTDYDFETDYGTHDWVAEAALMALLDNDPSGWAWLEERIEIYLVGTEAPDNSNVQMTLNGKVIEGMGDTPNHHIYFNEDGSVLEDNSALRVKSMGDLADVAIDEGKLDQAAFYLGAMTHYIADLGVYCHVAENNVAHNDNINFDGYGTHEQHRDYEARTYTRSNEYDDKEEFFQIETFAVGIKKPYDAAIEIANNTYNDPNPSEATIRDAIWMHNNFFDGWVQDYEDRAGESATNQLYYDRLEECLNNAIQTCASAINYYSNDILIEMISSTTVIINEENEIKINLTNENDGLIEIVQPKFVSSSSYDIVEQFILENSSTIVNMTTGQELTWTGKIQFKEVGDINV